MKSVFRHSLPRAKTNARWFLPFAAGILLGFFFFLSDRQAYIADPYFFGEDILRRFGYSSIYQKAFFWFVLSKRSKLFLSFLLSAFTSLYPCAVVLLFGWYGMSFAMIFSILFSRFGLRGLLIMAGLFLPQILLYFPCMVQAVNLFSQIYQCRKERCQIPADAQPVRISWMNLAIRIVILFVIYFFGIITECYVNPLLLKKLIKIL